jgi:hypothetical protein
MHDFDENAMQRKMVAVNERRESPSAEKLVRHYIVSILKANESKTIWSSKWTKLQDLKIVRLQY